MRGIASSTVSTSLALVGLLALSACLTAGCNSRLAVGPELITQHQLSNADLKGMHFYVSEDIILRRERGDRKTDGLKRAKALGAEHVILKAGTPGIAQEISPDTIKVSFKDGSSLTFRLTGAVNKVQGDGAFERKGFYKFVADGTDPATLEPYCDYLGKRYTIHAGLGAVLTINKDEVDLSLLRESEMPGRTLP